MRTKKFAWPRKNRASPTAPAAYPGGRKAAPLMKAPVAAPVRCRHPREHLHLPPGGRNKSGAGFAGGIPS